MKIRTVLFALSTLTSSAFAQWNPSAGQWGRVDAADVRVMTWNVQDGLCSTASKVEGTNSWCALARIVAAFQPDVLLLQEAGDNSGNGTGSGVDTTTNLVATCGLFLRGGSDPFHGSTPVTAYVQKYAPGFDLPFVFVPTESDGFNRNVILSRFPFTDLNGDSRSFYADIPNVATTLYAPGGDGGIRGFQFVEIDLPNATFVGDLVAGGAHLKSGSAASDHDQRIAAAQNVAYLVQHWFNGNGGSTPDPFGAISDSPAATLVLNASTPVVITGDWNEDELTNGTKGPAEWLTQAAASGGMSDGTDRDGSDMTYDGAVHFFSGSRATIGGSSKLDYVAWQDSIATQRLSTVFNSATNPAGTQPPELTGFSVPANASGVASDHRPVVVDFVLPFVDCNGNDVADTTDIASGTSSDANFNSVPDECESAGTAFCFGDGSLATPCPCAPPDVVPFPTGAPGHGCANSLDLGGALLTAIGGTSPDTVTIHVDVAPSYLGFGFSIKGDGLDANGIAASDGLRCTTGQLIRFGGHNAGTNGDAPGEWSYPNAVQTTAISVATAQPAVQTAYYQLFYRNAAAGFCNPSTANLSNGVMITWP